MQLFCLGFGYCADYLSRILESTWTISGTKRSFVNSECLSTKHKIKIYDFDSLETIPTSITHLLVSIPPRGNVELSLNNYRENIIQNSKLKWIGYLSSTGVYGDHKGAWVDENSNIDQELTFSRPRIIAEKNWLDLYKNHGKPVHIFRLAGIYGPKRSELEKLQCRQSRIIRKNTDHVFSRIHVIDIAHALKASMEKPTPGEIFNVADDMPCAHEEVVNYAAKLLDVTPPIPEYYDKTEMSDMLRYFYSKSARVSNKKLKEVLEMQLLYPTYKEGLQYNLNKLLQSTVI